MIEETGGKFNNLSREALSKNNTKLRRHNKKYDKLDYAKNKLNMAQHYKQCQKNANTWGKIAICIIIKIFLKYEDFILSYFHL